MLSLPPAQNFKRGGKAVLGQNVASPCRHDGRGDGPGQSAGGSLLEHGGHDGLAGQVLFLKHVFPLVFLGPTIEWYCGVYISDRNEAVLKEFEAKALANIEGGIEAPPNMRVNP
jgi:hypothetical protein